MLEKKINYIKDVAREKKSVAHRYFSDSLLDDILEWKETRNQLIHALLKQSLTTEHLADIAYRGSELTKLLRNRANSFNKAIERKSDQ